MFSFLSEKDGIRRVSKNLVSISDEEIGKVIILSMSNVEGGFS